MDFLQALDPRRICGTVRTGRVSLSAGGECIAVALMPSYNAAPLAAGLMSVEEALSLAAEIARLAILIRDARATTSQPQAPRP